MSPSSSPRLDRRTALKWMATASASAMLLPAAFAQPASATNITVVAAPTGPGYGTDPDLMHDYTPGELWPLSFTSHQRQTAAVLCGLIIPADSRSPSAADLNVHDFIDEWISSPYPTQAGDRELILSGLSLLDSYAHHEAQADFVALDFNAQSLLCDQLASTPGARATATPPPEVDLPKLRKFFRRFRELTAGGFFTTPEGFKDIGYLGNVPVAAFPKPPEDLLARLGLT